MDLIKKKKGYPPHHSLGCVMMEVTIFEYLTSPFGYPSLYGIRYILSEKPLLVREGGGTPPNFTSRVRSNQVHHKGRMGRRYKVGNGPNIETGIEVETTPHFFPANPNLVDRRVDQHCQLSRTTVPYTRKGSRWLSLLSESTGNRHFTGLPSPLRRVYD